MHNKSRARYIELYIYIEFSMLSRRRCRCSQSPTQIVSIVCLCMCHVHTCELGQAMHCVYRDILLAFAVFQRVKVVYDERSVAYILLFAQPVGVRAAYDELYKHTYKTELELNPPYPCVL